MSDENTKPVAIDPEMMKALRDQLKAEVMEDLKSEKQREKQEKIAKRESAKKALDAYVEK